MCRLTHYILAFVLFCSCFQLVVSNEIKARTKKCGDRNCAEPLFQGEVIRSFSPNHGEFLPKYNNGDIIRVFAIDVSDRGDLWEGELDGKRGLFFRNHIAHDGYKVFLETAVSSNQELFVFAGQSPSKLLKTERARDSIGTHYTRVFKKGLPDVKEKNASGPGDSASVDLKEGDPSSTAGNSFRRVSQAAALEENEVSEKVVKVGGTIEKKEGTENDVKADGTSKTVVEHDQKGDKLQATDMIGARVARLKAEKEKLGSQDAIDETKDEMLEHEKKVAAGLMGRPAPSDEENDAQSLRMDEILAKFAADDMEKQILLDEINFRFRDGQSLGEILDDIEKTNLEKLATEEENLLLDVSDLDSPLIDFPDPDTGVAGDAHLVTEPYPTDPDSNPNIDLSNSGTSMTNNSDLDIDSADSIKNSKASDSNSVKDIVEKPNEIDTDHNVMAKDGNSAVKPKIEDPLVGLNKMVQQDVAAQAAAKLGHDLETESKKDPIPGDKIPVETNKDANQIGSNSDDSKMLTKEEVTKTEQESNISNNSATVPRSNLSDSDLKKSENTQSITNLPKDKEEQLPLKGKTHSSVDAQIPSVGGTNVEKLPQNIDGRASGSITDKLENDGKIISSESTPTDPHSKSVGESDVSGSATPVKEAKSLTPDVDVVGDSADMNKKDNVAPSVTTGSLSPSQTVEPSIPSMPSNQEHHPETPELGTAETAKENAKATNTISNQIPSAKVVPTPIGSLDSEPVGAVSSAATVDAGAKISDNLKHVKGSNSPKATVSLTPDNNSGEKVVTISGNKTGENEPRAALSVKDILPTRTLESLGGVAAAEVPPDTNSASRVPRSSEDAIRALMNDDSAVFVPAAQITRVPDNGHGHSHGDGGHGHSHGDGGHGHSHGAPEHGRSHDEAVSSNSHGSSENGHSHEELVQDKSHVEDGAVPNVGAEAGGATQHQVQPDQIKASPTLDDASYNTLSKTDNAETVVTDEGSIADKLSDTTTTADANRNNLPTPSPDIQATTMTTPTTPTHPSDPVSIDHVTSDLNVPGDKRTEITDEDGQNYCVKGSDCDRDPELIKMLKELPPDDETASGLMHRMKAWLLVLQDWLHPLVKFLRYAVHAIHTVLPDKYRTVMTEREIFLIIISACLFLVHVLISSLIKKSDRKYFTHLRDYAVAKERLAVLELENDKLKKFATTNSGQSEELVKAIEIERGLSKESQQKAAELGAERDKLHEKVAADEKELTDVRRSKDQLEKKLENLQKEWDELKLELAESKDNIAVLENDIVELQSALDDAQMRCSELDSSMEIKSSELSHAEDMKNRLDLEVSEWKLKYKELQTTSDELTENYSDMERTLRDTQKQLDAIKLSFKALTANMKGVSPGGEGWTAVDGVAGSPEDGWEAEDDAVVDVDVEEQLSKFMDAAKLKAEIRSLEDEKESLKATVAKEVDSKRSMESQMEACRASMEELRRQCQDAEKQAMEAKMRLEILTEHFNKKETELQKQLGMQQVLSEQKEQKLGDSTSELKNLRDQRDNFDHIISDLKADIEQRERDFQRYKQSAEKQKHEYWQNCLRAERERDSLQMENKYLRNRQFEFSGFGNKSPDMLSGVPIGNGKDPGSSNSSDVELAALLRTSPRGFALGQPLFGGLGDSNGPPLPPEAYIDLPLPMHGSGASGWSSVPPGSRDFPGGLPVIPPGPPSGRYSQHSRRGKSRGRSPSRSPSPPSQSSAVSRNQKMNGQTGAVRPRAKSRGRGHVSPPRSPAYDTYPPTSHEPSDYRGERGSHRRQPPFDPGVGSIGPTTAPRPPSTRGAPSSRHHVGGYGSPTSDSDRPPPRMLAVGGVPPAHLRKPGTASAHHRTKKHQEVRSDSSLDSPPERVDRDRAERPYRGKT